MPAEEPKAGPGPHFTSDMRDSDSATTGVFECLLKSPRPFRDHMSEQIFFNLSASGFASHCGTTGSCSMLWKKGRSSTGYGSFTFSGLPTVGLCDVATELQGPGEEPPPPSPPPGPGPGPAQPTRTTPVVKAL
jgi:hypothetical protein